MSITKGGYSMITALNRIITKLPGSRVLVEKTDDQTARQNRNREITENLKHRDMEVRIHESSHGNDPNLIRLGPVQYDYTVGPDGRAYATGGRVTLSTGGADTPEQALIKAEALKRASTATGNPSQQDFAALSAAITMEYEARNSIYTENNLPGKNRPGIKGSLLNIYA